MGRPEEAATYQDSRSPLLLLAERAIDESPSPGAVTAATAAGPDRAPEARGAAVLRALTSPGTRVLAAVALVLSLVLPPGGMGPTLCWFQAQSHLPCPGCGMTRSLVSLAHLDLGASWAYHPFGLVAAAIFVFSLVTLLLGRRGRAWLQDRFERHGRMAHVLYRGFVAAFLTYGLVRLVLAAVGLVEPAALG